MTVRNTSGTKVQGESMWSGLPCEVVRVANVCQRCARAIHARLRQAAGICLFLMKSCSLRTTTVTSVRSMTTFLFTLSVSHTNNQKELGELEAALAEYHRAIDLETDLTAAWLNLGVTLTALDREDEAIDVYKVLRIQLRPSATREKYRFLRPDLQQFPTRRSFALPSLDATLSVFHRQAFCRVG